ncbi:sensor histidine kinase [Sporomusa sphaeroides]|uniref:sensor histidine kinase n=1 Tax=Sporomusa sphaeroides TaxID=47679 RepID=UPI002C3EC4D1|nr:ATP-binding protein [Sporomusa sphaeroides]HML35163.1 ATP-binding protein [Sporomusa sphaeroides]
MKISLQYKMLGAFMTLVILVLTGVSVGGSVLIRDYFVARKQHELTDKAYEMARMVNAYYDGRITHGQLHNFVNSVDNFLDARVWVVDKDLNLITVSEERPDEGQGNRRPASVVKPSPMHPTMWDCDLPGTPGGMMMPRTGEQQNRQPAVKQGQEEPKQGIPKASQPAPPQNTNGWECDWPGGNNSGAVGNWRSGRQNMMGGMGGHPGSSTGQPVQPSRSAIVTPPVTNHEPILPADNVSSASQSQQPPIVLDVGKGAQNDEAASAAISLADIKGMTDIIQAIEANYGQTWAKTYYHPYYEEDMLIVAVPLQRSDGTMSGTVMINAPIVEINGFLQHVYYYLGLAGLAAILLAIVLAAFMARHIVRPLTAMQETAAALAHGDYDRRVTITSRDEVGDLGQSLNSLAKDLGEYVRQMEMTDRMRRDFVANVSHELRTPLTIMYGYNQALQDGTITEAKKVKKYHRVMGGEILRLEKLIAELLDLSQLQATGITLETEDVPLAEVIDNVITLMKQKSEQKGVTLAAQIDPIPSIRGDGDRLTQLVLILVDNALKFTPAGGQISVSLAESSDSVVLTIADTGVGIASGDLPHIWERFYKADKSRASGGTGLGLAIAWQIIELHGAAVDVTSTCGQGTTFIIRFPRKENSRR